MRTSRASFVHKYCKFEWVLGGTASGVISVLQSMWNSTVKSDGLPLFHQSFREVGLIYVDDDDLNVEGVQSYRKDHLLWTDCGCSQRRDLACQMGVVMGNLRHHTQPSESSNLHLISLPQSSSSLKHQFHPNRTIDRPIPVPINLR